ncbi:hypothetical protein [Vibrio sonorensis]|uniref:hypothetical protein n=1 Tax=Vibrio sonorensis TaxID=1004316 RepID=UPI000A029A05|nr:hypothetical protein [Vibrio sonorensis]
MSLTGLILLASALQSDITPCPNSTHTNPSKDVSVLLKPSRCDIELSLPLQRNSAEFHLDNQSVDYSSYWGSWLVDTGSEPLLSQSYHSNYFGVGIWMPEDLSEESAHMNTKEWLENQGLQFSLGFGDLNSGEPRLRLDYRWHEVYQAM